jgi:hypothetical protein
LFYAMKRRFRPGIIALMKGRADVFDKDLGDFEGFCERFGLFEFYKYIKKCSLEVRMVAHKRRWEWWSREMVKVKNVV